MNTKELIANINRTKYELETALEENGGELTEELLAQADALEDMKALLAGEGIDDLGRWLKAVQDETAALKAEADAAARRLKNHKSYEEYIKFLIGQALDAIGTEKAKGNYYGFTRTTSTKSEINYEAIEDAFGTMVEDLGIPKWLHIQFKTTTKEMREAGGDALAFLEEDTTPALRFNKPRANQKTEGEA